MKILAELHINADFVKLYNWDGVLYTFIGGFYGRIYTIEPTLNNKRWYIELADKEKDEVFEFFTVDLIQKGD